MTYLASLLTSTFAERMENTTMKKTTDNHNHITTTMDINASLSRCAYLLARIADGDHRAMASARDAYEEASRLLQSVGGLDPLEAEDDDTVGLN